MVTPWDLVHLFENIKDLIYPSSQGITMFQVYSIYALALEWLGAWKMKAFCNVQGLSHLKKFDSDLFIDKDDMTTAHPDLMKQFGDTPQIR